MCRLRIASRACRGMRKSFSLKVESPEVYDMFGMIGVLRIHEIIDKPNWLVGRMIPRRLFGSLG